MTISTILCFPLFCAASIAVAQGSTPPVIACNTKAISAAERPRYNDLMRRLRLAIRNRSEIRDGYTFRLDGQTLGLPEVADWISMERLCCPFLTFQLSASGNQSDWDLKLTGPKGVKAVLQVEFPKPVELNK
jgi:hypothetical protein